MLPNLMKIQDIDWKSAIIPKQDKISPEGGHGNPLQYSCLENALDRGAWWATVPGMAKSQTRLSD